MAREAGRGTVINGPGAQSRFVFGRNGPTLDDAIRYRYASFRSVNDDQVSSTATA